MNLTQTLTAAAAEVAAKATEGIYDLNVAMWQAQVNSDHIVLAMPGTNEPEGIPVSRIRVARASASEFVWHTTVGFPTDPDLVEMPVRVLRCEAGKAPTRAAAHQLAGMHLGLILAPYMTLPER